MCWWSQAPCEPLREWKPATIPWVWGSFLENEERAGSFQVICCGLSQWSPRRYTAGVTDELQSSGHHWSIHRRGPWMPVHLLNHSSPTYLAVTHPRCIVLTVTSLESGESRSPEPGPLEVRGAKLSASCQLTPPPPDPASVCFWFPGFPLKTLTRHPSRTISCLIQIQL